MQKAEVSKIEKIVMGNTFEFDRWYAEAWSRKQGGFSEHAANTLINYLKSSNHPIRSALDVCSGSGEFISIIRNITTECMGVDNADGYLEYAKCQYSDVNFQKVEKLYDFKLKKKFDLISCNRDVVNMFTTFDKWKMFFNTAYNHLQKNGFFMFDFYTEKKLAGWSEVIYEQGDDLDYVSKVTQNNGLCVMSEVYYLKESSTYYRKTSDVMVEAWFKTEDIVKALEEAGFRKIKLLNKELKPLEDSEIEKQTRIHVLAEK